jgi:hypothetical protein
MRMKKVERLGIKPISEFELKGIMFRKLGEERLDKEKLEIKLEELKK